MNILAQNDDTLIDLHTPVQHISNDVDKFALFDPAIEVRFLDILQARQFGSIATNTDIAEVRFRPQPRLDNATIVHAIRQLICNILHDLFATRSQRIDTSLIDKATCHHFSCYPIQRILPPPAFLFLFRAIAEGRARERTVLMEVAVNLGLDDGRTVSGAHMCKRLFHSEIDRKRIHPVNMPRWNGEGLSARGQTRFCR